MAEKGRVEMKGGEHEAKKDKGEERGKGKGNKVSNGEG